MTQATDDVTSDAEPRTFTSFMINPAVDLDTLRDDLLNKFEMLKGCIEVITRHPELGGDTYEETQGIRSMAWAAEALLEEARVLFRNYDRRLKALARMTKLPDESPAT